MRPLSSPWPAGDDDAVAVAQRLAQGVAVEGLRHGEGGDEPAVGMVGREELEPEGPAGGAQPGPHRARALPHRLQPRGLDAVERRVEPEDQRDRRREGALRALALGVERALPVEVEARAGGLRRSLQRALGRRHEGQPRRQHQRLLRPGHDDVEAPGVRLQRGGAEARRWRRRRAGPSGRACAPRRPAGRAPTRSRSRSGRPPPARGRRGRSRPRRSRRGRAARPTPSAGSRPTRRRPAPS